MTDDILLEGKLEYTGLQPNHGKQKNVKLSQHYLYKYDFNNAANVTGSFRFHFHKTKAYFFLYFLDLE